MAKKSSNSKSSAKAPAKVSTKTTSKANVKAPAKAKLKAVAKLVKKPTVKATPKTTSKVVAKPTVKSKVIEKAAQVKNAVAKFVENVAPKAKTPVIAAKVVATKSAPAKPAAVKPAMMTKKGKTVESPLESDDAIEEPAAKSVKSGPKDQGDLLIEKAKEEMAGINSAAKLAEKNSKIKPIKIERGNAADEKAKWQELYKRHSKDKAENYNMRETFESMKPIQHKVLGWGFILSNENNRLEVLFENGIKMLISNYKPS